MAELVWRIGDVRITRIAESVTPVPPQGLFPGAEPGDLARHESWLKPHFVDGEGNLLLSIHDLLVIGTHYAEPCSGRPVADGRGGHRFEASPS